MFKLNVQAVIKIKSIVLTTNVRPKKLEGKNALIKESAFPANVMQASVDV
jgi:hypothetical protein